MTPQTSTKTPGPRLKVKSGNQESSEKVKMVVTFKYFDSKETEAYTSFFEENGVQVIKSQTMRATHVISKRCFGIYESFAAIVTGLWVLKLSYVEACMKANKILTHFSDFESDCILHLRPKKNISEDLAAIVGARDALEHDVGKKVGAYIKENKLEDLTNSKQFKCDKKLNIIFGSEKFKYLDMFMHLCMHKHMSEYNS